MHPKVGRKQSDPGFLRNCTSTLALCSPLPCVHTLFIPAVSPLLPCVHPCPVFTPALSLPSPVFTSSLCSHLVHTCCVSTPALCSHLLCVHTCPVFSSCRYLYPRLCSHLLLRLVLNGNRCLLRVFLSALGSEEETRATIML